jgi:hypothetical protein
MKQIARLDYLDLQIYDEQKTTLIIPQADEDGLLYSSTLMVSDALAYELFAMLKMPCHSSSWNSRVLYQSENKEIFCKKASLRVKDFPSPNFNGLSRDLRLASPVVVSSNFWFFE